jgi:hypothetical protein
MSEPQFQELVGGFVDTYAVAADPLETIEKLSLEPP